MLQSSCMMNMLSNPLADLFVYVFTFCVCVCAGARMSLVCAFIQVAFGRCGRSPRPTWMFSQCSKMLTKHFELDLKLFLADGFCSLVAGSSCGRTDVVLGLRLLAMCVYCVSHAHHLPVLRACRKDRKQPTVAFDLSIIVILPLTERAREWSSIRALQRAKINESTAAEPQHGHSGSQSQEVRLSVL